MTKQELIQLFSDGHLVQGADFENLINSLKALQTPVSDPTGSGTSTTFISNISQDAEGKVTASKKTVNFSGYQTTTGMRFYQINDLQQVDEITAAAGDTQTIEHKMGHYPTVRLLDSNGVEVNPSNFTVTHASLDRLSITLGSSLIDRYNYVLD